MHVALDDIRLINRLRRTQNIITPEDLNWNDTIKYADPAVHGILSYAKKQGYSPPEVGYEVTDKQGRVIVELELAWPDTKYGVFIGDPPTINEWQLHSILEALKHLGGRA